MNERTRKSNQSTKPVLFLASCVLFGAQHTLGQSLYTSALVLRDGSTQDDGCTAICVDGSGDVIVAGSSEGDFGGTPAGLNDIFVAKFDKDGTELWRRQIGSTADDDATGLDTDGQGNIYVCGQTKGVLTSPTGGFYDAFLTRLDCDGTIVWTRQFGTLSIDGAWSVAANSSGDTYLCGWTLDSLGGPNLGNYDCFIVKYDSGGTQVWARQFGTVHDDSVRGIALDTNGDVLVAGSTMGSFGGVAFGDSDVYLVRFDESGDTQWIRQVGSASYDSASGVAVDPVGNSYVVGTTLGDLGGPNLGHSDAYTAKFSPDGEHLWTRHHGTSLWDYATSVGTDESGYAFVAIRWLHGPFTFFGTDARAIKYSPGGATLWLETVSTSDNDSWGATAIDKAGRVWFAGTTNEGTGNDNDLLISRFDPKQCYADCDDDGVTDYNDLICFHLAHAAGNPYSDCTEDGVFDIFDYLCFQNSLVGGCP